MVSPRSVEHSEGQSQAANLSTRRWTKPKIATILLVLILLGSASVAVHRVFLAPIFQSPDEPAHLNYALNIYSAGRLYSAREPYRQWNTSPEGRHVYTWYLITATRCYDVRSSYSVKVPAEYGTSEYYERLDRDAPAEHSGDLDEQPQENPRRQFDLITIYPFAYYWLLALWVKLTSLLSSRLTVLFFGARILSTVLLLVNLLLMYATAREVQLSRAK